MNTLLAFTRISAAFLLLWGITLTALAQTNDNKKTDPPAYHELPEYGNQQEIEIPEETDESNMVAMLSVSNLPGVRLAETTTELDIAGTWIFQKSFLGSGEDGLNALAPEDLEPIAFRSENNESGGSSFGVSVGGSCGTGAY